MNLRTLLILSAICTPVMIAIMVIHGAPLKIADVTPNGIIDLELAGTPHRALEIYQAWSPELLRTALKNTYIDFLFLVSYGSLLCCLCLTVSRWYTSSWRAAGKWISLAMIVAAFFDAFENILMIKTLNGSMGKELIASTFMFSSVKFLLVAIGILYILLSLIGRGLKTKQVQVQELS
jgi:small-conductance mechanosensitive channel